MNLKAFFLSGVFSWIVLMPSGTAHAAAPDTRTEAVAVVNGERIEREELDAAVAERSRGAGAARPEARLPALTQLVRQRLLSQAARGAGLASEPATLAQVARSKRLILGEAYRQKALSAVPQPTPAQIDQFIAKNPQFFRQRQTFHLWRTTLETPDEWPRARVETAVAQHPTWPGLKAFLQSQKIHWRTESQWLGAERIDAAELRLLDSLRDGEFRIVPGSASHTLVLIERKAAYPDPLDPVKVRRAVAQGLWLEAIDTASKALVDNLRAQARIEMPGESSAMATRFVAKVNDEEISPQELQEAMAVGGERPSAVSGEARRKALEALIDEVLLAQQARAQRLDQQAALAAQLRQVETDVLARRYLALEAEKLPRPSAGEVSAFMAERPETFANRKIYHFTETVIDRKAATHLAEAERVLASLADGPALEQKLRSLDWPYGVNNLWLGLEQISSLYRQALAAAAPGAPLVLSVADGEAIAVVRKLAEYRDALPAEEAERLASQVLASVARTEATEALVKRLYSAGKVTLAAEFSGPAPRKAGGFHLGALGGRQLLAWAAVTLQVMVFVLLPGSLVWFYFHSDHQPDLGRWRDRAPSWRDRWLDFSNGYVFLLGLAAFLGAIGMLLSLPLWGSLLTAATPSREAMVIANAVGLGIPILGFSLLYWRRRSAGDAAKPSEAVRWLPLGVALVLQVLLYAGGSRVL